MMAMRLIYRRSASVTSTLFMLASIRLVAEVEAGPQEDRLLRRFFYDSHYFPTSRPVANDSDSVLVKFCVNQFKTFELDMKKEVARINLWLYYEWHDYKLAWNASEYGGVSSVTVPVSDIWIPDVVLYNSAYEDMETEFDKSIKPNVRLFADGTCQWFPPGRFSVPCPIDISWFPFDDQTCTLIFQSWLYDGFKLNLSLALYKPENSVANGEWNLLDMPAKRVEEYYESYGPAPIIDITYDVHLRRRPLYYVIYMILPTSVISFMSLLAFLLPSDSGEKIGLGITLLLSMTVFQLIIADKVPESSQAIPLVAVYVGIIMAICTLSLVMNIIVLNIYHTSPQTHMPRWVRVVFFDGLARLMHMKKPRNDASLDSVVDVHRTQNHSNDLVTCNCNPPEDASLTRDTRLTCNEEMQSKGNNAGKHKKTMSDWMFLATVIDRFCFCVFTMFFGIATVVVFRRQLLPI